MKNITTISSALIALLMASPLHAAGEDDPVLGKVMIDQLERRSTQGPDPWVLEADAWIGKDLNKAWFKLDAEQVNDTLEEMEIQALYSRAIDPYWDLQAGWRHNNKPKPERDWLAVGVKGLAPYWFEVDASAFVGKNGQINARVSAEYELMLTQKWVLSPEIEANIFSKDDLPGNIGSGLSDIQAGLRLRYEIRREFAPYIGVNWNGSFGKTADLARAAGEKTRDTQWVIGVRAWF